MRHNDKRNSQFIAMLLACVTTTSAFGDGAPSPVYTLMNDELTWFEANAACWQAGMELASVYTEDQNKLLAAAAKGNTVWMGGTDAFSEKKWKWTPWGESASEDVSYNNWSPNQPNDWHTQDCMRLNGENQDDQWDDDFCDHRQKFVCQKNPPPPEYVLMNDTLPWDAANAACLKAGMELASVYSGEANKKLRDLVTAAGAITVWIGGTDAFSEGEWKWTPSTSLSYQNWTPGQPNNYNDNQNCMAFNQHDDGKWDDNDCAMAHQYVCQKPTQKKPPPPVAEISR